MFLTSKFILKSLSQTTNEVIDRLYDLQISLAKKDKYNLSNRFLLYKVFTIYSKYSTKIAAFNTLPIHSFPYDTSTFLPDTFLTSSDQTKTIQDSQFSQLAFQAIHAQHIENRHLFYTDASKIDSSTYVGFAFYSPTLKTQVMFHISGIASIFTGECLAIIHCVDFILVNNIEKSSIFSDSLSIIQVISSGKIMRDNNYLILTLKEKLKIASQRNLSIRIIWIPAHSGILGNETADILAKKAVGKGQFSPFLLPHSDFYSIPRDNLVSSTRKFLSALAKSKGTEYHNLYPPYSTQTWFNNTDLNRFEITTTSRIRSNQYNLNCSLHRCNIVSSPECNCREATQDIIHILWTCPLLQTHHSHLLQSLQKYTKSPPP